jgi:hypothetical protein
LANCRAAAFAIESRVTLSGASIIRFEHMFRTLH